MSVHDQLTILLVAGALLVALLLWVLQKIDEQDKDDERPPY